MMKEIIEKLKGVLSEADLAAFQESVNKVISEKVALKVEEKTAELEKMADEYCEKQITEQVEAKTKALSEKYEEDLESLESNIVEKLDQYLELEISEKISDELLEKVALNETYEPIVKGVMELFESKYVALDSEGSKMLKDLTMKVESLEDKLSTKINENIELNSLCEKAAVKTILSEKTIDLTPTQRQKVVMFFEGKDFDSIQKNIDSYVEMISEELSIPGSSSMISESAEDAISDEDGTKDLVTESFKPEKKEFTSMEKFLMRGSQYMYE
jgi:hypothetical protein